MSLIVDEEFYVMQVEGLNTGFLQLPILLM